MRYKAAVSTKLDRLKNTFSNLRYILTKNPTVQDLDAWIENTKEQIEEIETLVNTEQGESSSSW